MLNPFVLAPNELLLAWREFRQSLNKLPEAEILPKIAQWFSLAPLGRWGLDPYDTKAWPTPWELIHQGDFCKSSLAYLMEQTLVLSGTIFSDANRLKLILIHDMKPGEEDIYHVLLVDDKYLLNYSYGEVVDFDKVRDDFVILSFNKLVNGKHQAIE
jgi:hypothetical protein